MNNPLVIPMSVSESATQFGMSLGSAVNVSGDVEIEALSVTENGTYQEQGKAYSPVTVNVAGLVPSGTLTITENGVYDVTEKASADVNVPQGGDVDGLIDGSIVALENDTATSIKREFASIVKRYNYRNLPQGYTQVEYIESHGTEYIDTGVLMDTTSAGRTAQFSFMMLERGVSPYYVGARADSTNNMTFLTTYYGTPSWNYTNKSGSGAALTVNRLYEIQCELRSGWQSLTIDGANQSQGTNAGTVTSSINFYAFARNNNGTADGLSKIRLYGLVIRNGNQNARKLCDLIPCLNDSTGEYGMYDLVSGEFKGNLGTGAFTGGDVIPDLTYGYTSADLSVTEIGAYAFYNNDLSSLTLRANEVVTLGDHALDGTPIADGTGTVYVPSDLVSAYEADSSWSQYNIVAIE